MRSARILLGSSGVGLIVVGGVEVLRKLGPEQQVGLAVWLAAAVVLHDGVVAPATAVVSRAVERAGPVLSPASRAVIRVGLVVGGVLTVVVLPEVAAQARGNPNPTVLPAAYGARLGWAWLLIVVAVVAGVLAAQRRSTVRGS